MDFGQILYTMGICWSDEPEYVYGLSDYTHLILYA